jgi:uncharacterized SAM-binding protein YcdF (DUF218 family)
MLLSCLLDNFAMAQFSGATKVLDTVIIEECALILWTYLCSVVKDPEPSDFIMVFGCSDLTVAKQGAFLWNRKIAPYLLCTGAFGSKTNHFAKPECEIFADIAASQGVPRCHIFLEDKSTNTAENIRFSKQMLIDLLGEISLLKIVAVTKPFAARRLLATFEMLWPEAKVSVSAEQYSFSNYIETVMPLARLIHSLVGTLSRLIVYSERGYIVPQIIPPNILEAYKLLKNLGYTDEMIS